MRGVEGRGGGGGGVFLYPVVRNTELEGRKEKEGKN